MDQNPVYIINVYQIDETCYLNIDCDQLVHSSTRTVKCTTNYLVHFIGCGMSA